MTGVLSRLQTIRHHRDAMKSTAMAVFLLFSSSVYSAVTRFTIIDPAPGTTWTSSTPVSIAWSFDPTDTTAAASTLRIDLGFTTPQGKDRILATIAGVVPASQRTINWTAPDVKTATAGFWIQLEKNKEKSGLLGLFESKDEARSGTFTIQPSAAGMTPAIGGMNVDGLLAEDPSHAVLPTTTTSMPTTTSSQDVWVTVTVKATPTAKAMLNSGAHTRASNSVLGCIAMIAGFLVM